MEQTTIFEVTECCPTYRKAIQQLLEQLTTSGVHFTDADLQQLIEAENSQLFLITYNQEIAGMLTLGAYLSPTGKKYWIEDVVVESKYRGKKLGALLVKHAIEQVAHQGNASLMLTSNPTRIAANHLYQTAGFSQKETNVYKMSFK